MPSTAVKPAGRDRVRSDGEWWVLLIADGFTVEFAPELYREREDAAREAERWARALSHSHGVRIERPFEGRWQIGDRWIRVTHSVLPGEGSQIWVGTYWGRDGSPDPEAALFADTSDAREWALEPPAGGQLVEHHETPWSVVARYRVLGGEEEAEVHRGKMLAALIEPSDDESRNQTVFGFQVSEGFIPQGPDLFSAEESRDRALRSVLESELGHRDWRDLVSGTASANYVDADLPADWRAVWDQSRSLEWLMGFDFIGEGADFEIRRFEVGVSH